ncbi:hypothetical protein AgCh_016138 [Apium graveolens]
MHMSTQQPPPPPPHAHPPPPHADPPPPPAPPVTSGQSPQANVIMDKIDRVATIIKSISMIPDVPIAALPSVDKSFKLNSLTPFIYASA